MKKRIMVHYRLVPADEDGFSNQPFRCWCLHLNRFRIYGIITVVILACFMTLLAFINTSALTFQNFTNTTRCENSTPLISGGNKSKTCYEQHSPTDPVLKLNSPFYKQRLPTVIIIGARKAGTRAVLQFINLHRSVAVAKKETHFFDRNYERGFQWYRLKMPYSYPHQITVEKTPNYFVDKDVPERVYRYNTSIKLLLIVRDPIDRAMSDYIQLKEKINQAHPEKILSFEELVIDQTTRQINKSYSPIKRSLYCRHIDKWLAYFPLRQILILDGDNMKYHPWEEIAKVEQFLGLPEVIGKSRFIFNQTKGFFCIRTKSHNSSSTIPDSNKDQEENNSNVPVTERCLAKSKGREHPAIREDVRLKLKKFFEPYNKRFYQRINHDFHWDS